MAYHAKRQKHLCFFFINPRIAAVPGVYFTDRNATANNHQRLPGIRGIRLVNFDAIRAIPRPSDREGWHQPVQAEVLVPNVIPLAYIEQVAFVSRASKAEAERLWQTSDHPPFIINRTYFADDQRKNSPINFSYLEDMTITSIPINENNYQNSFPNIYRFNRTTDSQVSLLAEVYSAGYAQGKVIWSFSTEVLETDFDTRNVWYHWPSLPLSKIPDGVHHVEYLIDGKRWLRSEFEV